jgi:endonuclease III
MRTAPGGVASNAAVDSMGCDRCHDEGEISEANRRFQILISAMLSSQTRDEVTHAAMIRLRAHGLTPQNLLRYGRLISHVPISLGV